MVKVIISNECEIGDLDDYTEEITMNRNDWLKELHEAAYSVVVDNKEVHLLTVIQEYDRQVERNTQLAIDVIKLTALNKKLLEALKERMLSYPKKGAWERALAAIRAAEEAR